jgi:hypothetical protein
MDLELQRRRLEQQRWRLGDEFVPLSLRHRLLTLRSPAKTPRRRSGRFGELIFLTAVSLPQAA